MALIAIGILIALIVFFLMKKAAKKRTIAMRAEAARLGWTFSAEPMLSYFPSFEEFALFSQGHSRKVLNQMSGEANGIKVAVFDYEYRTGSGRSASAYDQTVIYLQPVNLQLPNFSLRPEGLMTKIGAALGYEDID